MIQNKTITIQNFLSMTPEVPQGSDKNQHFLIQNSDPLYYQGTTTQEQQVAPLIASSLFLTALPGYVSNLNGNIVDIIPAKDGSKDVFVVTDMANVYAFPYVDYYTPTSPGPGSNPAASLTIFNDDLLLTSPNWGSPAVYRNSSTVPAIPWTNSFGTLQVLSGKRYMEPFLDFCAISVGDASYGYGHLIKKITSSFTITDGIDLGVNWACLGMKNFNNKYLAIAAGWKGGYTYNSNYVFLWDGISSRYNNAYKLPGRYQDMKEIGGTLYVMVLEANNQSALYYFTGSITTGGFKRVFKVGYFTVNSGIFGNHSICNFKNYIAINNYPGLTLSGDTGFGQAKFQLTKDLIETFCMGSANTVLYGGINDQMYYYNVGGTTYNQLDYTTQWFDIEGSLNNVKIFYETPPVAGTDAIHTSIYYETDENGTSPQALADITPTTYQNGKYTLLDGKGIKFTMLKLKLTTTNISTWRPIIRSIEINYTPTKAQ